MLEKEDFDKKVNAVTKWISDYFNQLESLPVKPPVEPGQIYSQFNSLPPLPGISTEQILDEITKKILPGMTHWQHPHFHAYFPANSSIESLFAEMITSAMAAQCMIWETSPAAAELEQRVTEWIASMMQLPEYMEGVIQDTASTATLAALLTAREKSTDFKANRFGVPSNLRVYASTEAHSSIDKAVAISGIGTHNLIKIDVDSELRMKPSKLVESIEKDIEAGYTPCCIMATIGTTGTVAVDNLEEIGDIAQRHQIWLHVDGAYAGTAAVLPEYRWILNGIEKADSFVFNPHKWMFTHFDCTVYFVKNAGDLIKTFEILPEYLKTKTRGKVNDYRDWGIPLGRRFRALKLWWVISSYGVDGIRKKLRFHIILNKIFADKMTELKEWVHVVPPFLNYSCIRWVPGECSGQDETDRWNEWLVEEINTSGKAFVSHTRISGEYVIRIVFGQTYLREEHVDELLDIITQSAIQVKKRHARDI